MGEEVVAVEGRVPVASELVEADLEVEDEEDLVGWLGGLNGEGREEGRKGEKAYGVVFVETLEGDGWMEILALDLRNAVQEHC